MSCLVLTLDLTKFGLFEYDLAAKAEQRSEVSITLDFSKWRQHDTGFSIWLFLFFILISKTQVRFNEASTCIHPSSVCGA
jgi:hypothetical protein